MVELYVGDHLRNVAAYPNSQLLPLIFQTNKPKFLAHGP